jgi:hypothetical protein
MAPRLHHAHVRCEPHHEVARGRRLEGFASACLVAGVALTVLADSGWQLAVGIASLCAFAALGFVASATIPDERGDGRTEP